MRNNSYASSQGSIGTLLRFWRKQKNKSQMELALDIGISTRHLSFVETGKSRPSREMVVYLGQALGLPYRQQNSLLVAAGYAAQFKEQGLDSESMQMVNESLQRLLNNHNPYPALVINSRYDILLSNAGYQHFVTQMIGASALQKYNNALALFYAEDGLKPHVKNWDVVAPLLLSRVHEEALSNQDDFLLDMIEKVTALDQSLLMPDLSSYGLPMLTLEFEKNGMRGSFFTTIATIGTPLDLMTQEIRLEMLYPVDQESKLFFEQVQI